MTPSWQLKLRAGRLDCKKNMKKIYSLLAGVLMCTLVCAHGTKNTATSSVVVTHSIGSTLFKLHYKSEKSGTVEISILNEKSKIIFSETIRKIDGFIRPYNFKDLPEGQYTLMVIDESGKSIEKVSYKNEKIEKLFHVVELNEVDKYMVTISFGVFWKQRSSRTLPAAIRRYWTTSSTGPWPMSVVPFQVPTSVFMRSKSGEPDLGLAGSSADRPPRTARRSVAQQVMILVFIRLVWI